MTERVGSSSERSSRLRTLSLAAGVAVAAVLLWGGYAHHWSWTGINGHTATLWDCLHLLILPLLVPGVLIPMLKPMAEAPMTPVRSEAEAGDGEDEAPPATGP